ncbi:aldo/keto reductase [Tardiphaga alba]|uniref:aldo/keto reductase n=1 Tax=Tardiphaga alba TaxID=340268 RepID=UPI001BA869FF|nr:aldo/keto reductase [Tardiphaga alba]
MASRLTLVTVQLGLPYGVANVAGRPGEAEAFAILDRALGGGIGALETARAYGASEEVIGRWRRQRAAPLQIITKLAPLTAVDGRMKRDAAERSLRASLDALAAPIDLVLAHRETDLLSPAVRDTLDEPFATLSTSQLRGS